MSSRKDGDRVKVSKGLDRWMQAEIRMKMEEKGIEKDCVIS